MTSVKIFWRLAAAATLATLGAGVWLHAQDETTFHVKVDMVVLGFTVTDQKGKYVNGLKPKDFRVYEDNIQQKVATYAEGNHAPLQVLESGDTKPIHLGSGSGGSTRLRLPVQTSSICARPARARTYSSSSIRATICIVGLCTPPTRSRISSEAWTGRTRLPFTLTAAI